MRDVENCPILWEEICPFGGYCDEKICIIRLVRLDDRMAEHGDARYGLGSRGAA